MMRSRARLLALLLPLALTAWAAGQESDYTSLFDGSDLTGWRYGKEVLHRQHETADKRFHVASTAIVANAKDKDGKKDTKALTTVREFGKDFTLRLEFKAAQEAIGSVHVRSLAVPVGDFIRRGEHQRLTKFKNDGWNELEVTVRRFGYVHLNGRSLTSADKTEVTIENGLPVVRVNGKVIDTIPLNYTVEIAFQGTATCNGQALTNARVPPKGNVTLNTGSGKIEFRNIRFKELP